MCVSLRVFCPANCKNEPSYWAPVVGNSFYTEVSTGPSHWVYKNGLTTPVLSS